MSVLRDVQDVDVNYYVLVPFTTAAGAGWAANLIAEKFDCHVVGVVAVDQDAIVVADVKA